MLRIFTRRKLVIPTIAICAIIFIILSLIDRGYFPGSRQYYGESNVESNQEKIYIETVIITSCEKREGGIFFTGVVENKLGLFSDKILLRIYDENLDIITATDYIGKTAVIRSYVSRPDKAANPRTFDYRKYLYSRGIRWIYNSDRIEVINNESRGNIILKIRRFLLKKRFEFLNYSFPADKEAGELCDGIIFGNSNMIDEEIYGIFQYMGTAHILAASGLHVGTIYGLYLSFLALIKKKQSKISLSIFFIILMIYGTVTLWSPSVSRAIFLVFIKLGADYFEKRFDMLSAVCFLNLVMVIHRPYQVFNSGFQMSFLAAYAISVLVPRMREKLPSPLVAPVVIQGFLGFYMIYNYNVISLLSIPANIVIVAIAGIYVPLGVTCFILWVLVPAPGICLLSGKILAALGRLICLINEIFYVEGRFTITISSQKGFWIVLVLGTILYLSSEGIMIMWKRNRKTCITVTCAFMGSLFIISHYFMSSPFDMSSQVFISVGQGDSFHISWEKDTDILIDGGGRYDYDVGNNILRPYLLHNGVGDIDLAISTHEHMDHFKGLQELRENFRMPDIITTGRAGDVIKINDDRYIKILWPIPGYENSDDENYYSRIFMVCDKGIKTLITGDITEEGELALIREYGEGDESELRCDILKVAHHGSRFSSSEDFLKAANPKVAVISVGQNNYGHPSPDVIEKLNESGIIIYRTDMDGAVGIIIEEDSFIVCTQKSMRLERYKRT